MGYTQFVKPSVGYEDRLFLPVLARCERRNQNPPISRVSSTRILKNRQNSTYYWSIVLFRMGADARPTHIQGGVVPKPPANFTRLDPGRLEIAILVDAMLRAREVVPALVVIARTHQ